MNVRLGYSQTLARPTFRELSPYTSYDVTLDERFQGYEKLQMSKVQNLDARWEWFPRPGEVVAVGGFYKQIKKPIEKVSWTTINDPVTVTNAPEAIVYGTELEARCTFDFIDSTLKPFSAGFNFAWIFSEVENPPNVAARNWNPPGSTPRPVRSTTNPRMCSTRTCPTTTPGAGPMLRWRFTRRESAWCW